jgi:hypothetical protein
MRTRETLFWAGLIGVGVLGAVTLRGHVVEAPAPSSRSPTPPRRRRRRKVRSRRLNYSTVGARGDVVELPEDLLEQARERAGDPSITMDELTGARLAASEHYSGSQVEWRAIVDAELNRAERKKRSLFEHMVAGGRGRFGKQGKGSRRRATTARDPTLLHLEAARDVLSGKDRGVSQGAVQFFDPKVMNWAYAQWRAGKKKTVTSCDALTLLEAWSFDYARFRRGGPRCPPDRSRSGNYTLAWVGPIEGVDPFELMLMEPMKPGPEHTRRYEAAKKVIKDRQGTKS